MMDLVTRLGRHARLIVLVVAIALAWVPMAHAVGIGHQHGHGSSAGAAADEHAGHGPGSWLKGMTPFCCQGTADCVGAETPARNSWYPVPSRIGPKGQFGLREIALIVVEPPPRAVA